MQYEKKWSWEVSQISDGKRVHQRRYRGTWRWNVGYVDNIMPSFPIFTVEESSHGYKRHATKGLGYKGPVIATKAEAIRQAKIALASAMIKDNPKL